MTPHGRLLEWVEHYPVEANYGSPDSLTYRMMREGLVGAAIKGAIQSDGGMFKAIKRYRNLIGIQARTREVNMAFSRMPTKYREVVDTEYSGRLTKPMAAGRLRMKHEDYLELRGMMLGWLDRELESDAPIIEAA